MQHLIMSQKYYNLKVPSGKISCQIKDFFLRSIMSTNLSLHMLKKKDIQIFAYKFVYNSLFKANVVP